MRFSTEVLIRRKKSLTLSPLYVGSIINSLEIPSLFGSCTPQDDLLSGTLSENEVAAKLSDVAFRPEESPDIYADPDTFFDKTYATESARRLTLDLPLPYEQTGKRDVREWLEKYSDFTGTE